MLEGKKSSVSFSAETMNTQKWFILPIELITSSAVVANHLRWIIGIQKCIVLGKKNGPVI